MPLMTIYPPDSYVWVHIISEEKDVSMDRWSGNNFGRMGCEKWVAPQQQLWLGQGLLGKIEVIGPGSSLTLVILNTWDHSYMVDRRESLRKELS